MRTDPAEDYRTDPREVEIRELRSRIETMSAREITLGESIGKLQRQLDEQREAFARGEFMRFIRNVVRTLMLFAWLVIAIAFIVVPWFLWYRHAMIGEYAGWACFVGVLFMAALAFYLWVSESPS